MARPQDVVTSSGHHATAAVSQPASSDGPNPSASGDAILTSLPVSSPKLITRPIEEIRPGMRVLATNPELKETLPDSNVTPDDWRLVSLTMTKENGGRLDVQLLRPIDWLAAEVVSLFKSVQDPQSLYSDNGVGHGSRATDQHPVCQLLIGQTIYLNLPELGAQGPATVTAIAECPAIEAPASGRRLVTGTFRHSAANVIWVKVASEAVPFGVTSNHPFWSLDRHAFVDAGDLRIGERLQCANGKETYVSEISDRYASPTEVFNFEVEIEHVYNVGTSGILVHNACPLSIFRSATHGSPAHHSEMVSQARSILGRSGVTNVRTNQALSDGTRLCQKTGLSMIA
jgi:hypothetical protein